MNDTIDNESSTKRLKYYIISLILGLSYFLVYLLFIFFMNVFESILVPGTDFIFLIINYVFFMFFIIKDTLDEINIQRNIPPIGPNRLEHSSFIFVLAFIVFYSISISTDCLILKIILILLTTIEGIWDLSQDSRWHKYPKFKKITLKRKSKNK